MELGALIVGSWPLDDGTLLVEHGIQSRHRPRDRHLNSIGQGADSTFWHIAGDVDVPLTDALDGVEAVSADGNVAEVLFVQAHGLGYAVNEFGCSADTTVVVEVIESSNTLLSAGYAWATATGLCNFLVVEAEVGAIAPQLPASGNIAGVPTARTGARSGCARDGTMMSLNLTHGTLELGVDFLTVFDGNGDAAPVLATLTGDVSGQTFMAITHRVVVHNRDV